MRPARLAQIAALAVTYTVFGRLGLGFDAVSGFATLVWPPTGIALAALVVLGIPLWPGVALGAFLVNYGVGASPAVALGIATGNTLEAVVGALLLRSVGFRPSMARGRDVIALVLLGASVGPVVSASIGVASLSVGGVVARDTVGVTWIAWWLGDLIGALLVAPLLMTWAQGGPFSMTPKWTLEGIGLVLTTAAVLFLVFGPWLPVPFSTRLVYLVFPCMIWAALRFGQRGVSTAMCGVSAAALAGTALHEGPFVDATLSQGLLGLQSFMAVVAIASLLLGATVAEREEATKSAQSAILARDEFLSIASHELRTPLSALVLQIGGLERALADSGAVDGDKVSPRVEKLARSAERMTRLVDELLDVSRITAGRMSLERERVDLFDVARDVVERMAEPAKKASTTISLAGGPTVGSWDKLRLEQIVTNLLSNAIRYGNGKPIHVEVGAQGHDAELSVRDRGIGIEAEEMEQIFDRFERAVSTRRYSGLGLGLYISRQVAEAHGGGVRAASVPGQGSTFTLSLPLTGAPEPKVRSGDP